MTGITHPRSAGPGSLSCLLVKFRGLRAGRAQRGALYGFPSMIHGLRSDVVPYGWYGGATPQPQCGTGACCATSAPGWELCMASRVPHSR